MLLRLFRPALARPACLTPFSTRITLPFCARNLTTSTVANPEPLTSFEPATISASSGPSPQVQLPYFVGRNNLNNLSVYQLKKRGGNMKVTLLKKGEGNLQALKQDVKDALQLPDGDVSVNSVTRHIVVRGHKRDQILNFLHTMGF
ncbi:Uu.00g146550.m01.CDS01 [Anthostomella pinea]|uniref:Large ribosomal subunit protein mL49 n=1 Tax=Anthostomella pinea TaxID=933095 RepID=A0AAI8VS34_9PEZI|nr:Uu.00g146550.m01.CDS01 [Anthostomella pinea]